MSADVPRVLTLAEVDAIAESFGGDGWRPTPDEVASLLRMARAMAIADAANGLKVVRYGDGTYACDLTISDQLNTRRGYGPTLTEAIEAADAARRTE